MSDLAWPIWTLELTPSSSTTESYPLEVGVASWTAPDATITTWSTPINAFSAEDWTEPMGSFLAQSGLSEEDLRRGMSPHDLGEMLNDIFLTSIVHGRGGTADIHLAGRLNLAAKVWPTYHLTGWRDVCERYPDRSTEAWDLIRRTTGDAGVRAGAIMRAIALLLGHSPDVRAVPTMAESLPL